MEIRPESLNITAEPPHLRQALVWTRDGWVLKPSTHGRGYPARRLGTEHRHYGRIYPPQPKTPPLWKRRPEIWRRHTADTSVCPPVDLGLLIEADRFLERRGYRADGRPLGEESHNLRETRLGHMEFPWDAEDGPEPKKPDGINDAFSAFLQRYGHYVKVDDPWNDPVHPEIALADPTQQQRWLDRLAETIEMHRARRREAKAEAFAFWERLGPTVAPPREGVKAYMRRKSLDDFLAQIGPNAPVSRPGDYLPPNADLSARIDRWWRERLMVNALKRLRRGVEHRDIARVERAVAWARRAIRGIFLVEGPWGAGALHHAEGDLPARTETDHAAYRQKLARFALKRSLVRDGKELGTSADGWRTPLRIIGPGGTLDRPRRTRVLPRPFKDDARDPERLPYGQPCPDRIDAPPSPPPCPGLDPDHRYPRPTIKESEHVVGSGGWRY